MKGGGDGGGGREGGWEEAGRGGMGRSLMGLLGPYEVLSHRVSWSPHGDPVGPHSKHFTIRHISLSELPSFLSPDSYYHHILGPHFTTSTEVKKPSVPGSNKRDDTEFTTPNKLTQTLPAPPFSMLNVLGTKLVWFVWEISFKCCAGPH